MICQGCGDEFLLILDIPAPDLGAIAIKAAATRAGLEADAVEAVVSGNAE
jgi:hypothetical protein